MDLGTPRLIRLIALIIISTSNPDLGIEPTSKSQKFVFASTDEIYPMSSSMLIFEPINTLQGGWN